MELLAKSKDEINNLHAISLKEHIEDCLIVLDFVKRAFPKAADISGIGLKFWDLLQTAIIFHDLGKAHREFQKVLIKKPNHWEFQRHELFSIPFIDAIPTIDNNTKQLLKLAVAGHHKDFGTLQQKISYYQTNNNFGMLAVDLEQKSFREEFEENVDASKVIDLLKDFNIKIETIKPSSIETLVRIYNKSPYNPDHPNYQLLLMLLGCLKWCDHLGSAKVTSIKNIENSDFDFLQIKQTELKLSAFDFYQHQIDSSKILGNLILTAPTGSGKTESAMMWLQNQMKHYGQGRVFYILPFTASINAMFDRLGGDLGKENVGMLHGKLSDYLNNYYDDLQYTVDNKKESIETLRNKFKSIATPLKVITPFQLLKHLFGLKGYEQGFIEMTGAYLIFDEIHAYNPETFAQIKILLEILTKNFKVRVMIMTATMPVFFQKELEQSIGTFEVVTANNKLYNQFKRHQIVLKQGYLKNSLEEIKGKLKAGKKVLVVCNTVKTSQQVYKELKNTVGKDKSVLLHGSFSGADRSAKEKKLKGDQIQLLVGTQAIEVSLDIDYDMIYTEPAPIDALIQRFGRVNRQRQKGICPCFVFMLNEENDYYIYNKETISKTILELQFIESQGGIIEEMLLQSIIDKVYPDWNQDDKKKFDNQYEYLQEAFKKLSPMQKNKSTEEDFYKQFDGVKVLPQSNQDAYNNAFNAFDFISGEAQKVQIRKVRFAQWINSENIKPEISVLAKKNKMLEQRYWITNKKYDSELGLISDEEDSWKTSEIW